MWGAFSFLTRSPTSSSSLYRLKHRIPLLGSPASAPHELLHLYSGDFALEW